VFAPGDSISHVIAFLYDVTERKLEAEELRQTRDLLARERSLLNATLEHMADGVVLLDAERRIILANAAYADMLALPRERHEGMTCAPFMAHLATLLADPAEALDRLALYREGPEDFVFARPRRRILRRLETRVQLPTGGAYLVTWRDVTAEADLLAERERQLTIDGLTGIANRTAAEAALRLEDARRRRSGARFSVAIFDIDHFKQVNDRYGHATGDEVLRFVAEALNGQARITDLVARWGGEEFLAVLPGPLTGAVAFAERAREAVERTANSKVERITVSVGVAEIGPDESLDAVIQRADEHLYEAKRRGRNRVVA
jgi:diguanylate cyclase (GGDEF)-like protein